MSGELDVCLADLAELHGRVDRRFETTLAAVGQPPGCAAGCNACCVDGLTVWQVEATAIIRWLAARAAEGAPPLRPQAPGRCVFLVEERCAIYPVRPYVCRSQGAVLRWHEVAESSSGDDSWHGDDGEAGADPTIERRDTCPEHLHEVDLQSLPESALFTIGPAESELVMLAARELAIGGGRGLPERVALRDLALAWAQEPST